MNLRDVPNESGGAIVVTGPLVTVVVPHYNRHALLPALVQNVVAQTYRPLELLVVDDGSDRPVNLEVRDEKGVSVRVISLPHSGCPGLVRNAGIDQATGELIAFLDSDDVWMPEKLSRQVGVLVRFPDVALVHGNACIVERGKRVPLISRLRTGFSVDFASLLKRNVVFTSSVMARRTVFDRQRFSALKSAQDYELWLRLAQECRFYYLDDPVYVYDHVGEECISRKGIRRYLCLVRIFRRMYRASAGTSSSVIIGRMAGFYFKLAKHSFLARREQRSRKMLLKSLQVRPNLHAVVALLLSCSSKASRWVFSLKRDY